MPKPISSQISGISIVGISRVRKCRQPVEKKAWYITNRAAGIARQRLLLRLPAPGTDWDRHWKCTV